MRNLFKTAIKYFLKKPNYLKKSIWFVSVLLAREVIALGTKEDWVTLANEFRTSVDLQAWQHWGIRILETIFIGGNWLVFFSLLGMLLILCAVLVVSKKNTTIVIGKHQYHSQLNTIEGFIQAFKPLSASLLAQQALKDIESSYLTPEEKVSLSAKAYWLLGRCRTANESTSIVYGSHVKSYELEPGNKTYQERACVSYYFLGQTKEALELTDFILKNNSLSERASAVKLMLDPSFQSLLNTRSQVKENQTFRRIYVQMLMNNKQEAEGLHFLEMEFTTQPMPSALDFSNIDYWESVGRYAFMKGMRSQPNIFVSVTEDYSKNEMVKYGHSILDAIHSRIKNTEAVETLGYQITLFYYFYSHYLLYRKADSVRSMRAIALKTLIHYSREFKLDVLFCFTQLGLHQETLDFADQVGDLKHPFVPLMKYISLKGLGKNPEAESEFIEYLKQLDTIGDLEVNNLLGFFDALERDKIAEVYKTSVATKNFKSELSKAIVFCYAHRYLPEFSEEIASNKELLVSSYPLLRKELQHVALIVLQALKEYGVVMNIIELHHDWKKEEVLLKLYTACVLIIREEGAKILEVLKYRRTHHPEERLFIEEVKIHIRVDNYEEVLNSAETGLRLYPQNVMLKFYHIFSLYKRNKKQDLLDQLNDQLFALALPWQQKYNLAKICVENGKSDLGFELFYQETIANYLNPAVKEHYFALITMSQVPAIWPEAVVPGTYVLLDVNGKQSILEIPITGANENTFTKNLLGLQINNTAEVSAPLTGKTLTARILHIFDKYSGLVNKIRLEIEESEVSGMNFKSVNIPGSNPEDFTKKLIEEFGEAGEKRKKLHDEALNDYHVGKLSFSELIARSNNKVFDVYGLLTSAQSNGFRVVPLKDFENFIMPNSEEAVIDLTTLPILFELSNHFPELPGRKFIISQYAIEYIQAELQESKSYPQERMTVVITTTGVRPHVQSSEVTQQYIARLEKLLEWVEKNCETRFSMERLDMALKNPDLIREDDFYFNYLIDTAFLSMGRFLVSDDAIHYRLGSGAQTISIEYFLSSFYKERYRQDFLPTLIRYHYIGIRIYPENLEAEFKKLYYGGKSTYDYCLENLPYSVNHDETVIEDCIEFVKFIYLEPMPLQAKKDYSQKIFLHALKQYPDIQWLKKGFLNLVKSKFNLLPTYLEHVLEDAMAAIRILNSRIQ